MGTALDDAAGTVGAALADVFGYLDELAEALAALHARARDAGQSLSPERTRQLRDPIQARLAALRIADGMGLVLAPGVAGSLERHAEWWHPTAAGYAPLRLNFDASSVDVYDYLAMDWFTVPRDTGRRCVYGPYIDYSGADRYIFTITVPVLSRPVPSGESGFLGIAGADVPLANLEPGLIAALRKVPAPAVLITAERRVLTANTPEWIAGDRVARMPAAGDGTFAEVAEVGEDSGWVLAAAG